MTITSGILGFFAAIALMFDWFDLITKFQLKRNTLDWEHALKRIDQAESKLQQHLEGKQVKDNYSLIGALYGLFLVQRINTSIYDKIHQIQRHSLNLEYYSLQQVEGILSRDRVMASFSEIQYAILKRREENEQRDLRIVTFWLATGTFVTGTAAALI
ncbi:hypothetical protein [Agrobacterium cavarae]|uniref:hypothetical protein n=1 Tax=Agrobacterium cavarae TaxID=2528239 RepID=UPI003FD1B1C6